MSVFRASLVTSILPNLAGLVGCPCGAIKTHKGLSASSSITDEGSLVGLLRQGYGRPRGLKPKNETNGTPQRGGQCGKIKVRMKQFYFFRKSAQSAIATKAKKSATSSQFCF